MPGANKILAKSSAVFDTLSLLMQRVKNRRWATKSNSIILWELSLLFASVALTALICQLLPEPERKLPSVIIPLGDFLRMFPDSIRNMFHSLFLLIDRIVTLLTWPFRFIWAQIEKILLRLGLRAVFARLFGPILSKLYALGLKLRPILRVLFAPFLWIGNVMATLSVGFIHIVSAILNARLEMFVPDFLRLKLGFLGPIIRFPFTLIRWIFQFVFFLLLSLFRTLRHLLIMIQHMTIVEMLKFGLVRFGLILKGWYYSLSLFLHRLHLPGFRHLKLILRLPLTMIQWVYSFLWFVLASLWRLLVHMFSLQRLVDWWDNLCVPDGSYCGEMLKREISELSQSIKDLKDEIHNLKLSQA